MLELRVNHQNVIKLNNISKLIALMSSYLYKMSVVPKKPPKHLVNDWKCMESNIVGLDAFLVNYVTGRQQITKVKVNRWLSEN
jgi:hypothetical protein